MAGTASDAGRPTPPLEPESSRQTRGRVSWEKIGLVQTACLEVHGVSRKYRISSWAHEPAKVTSAGPIGNYNK